MPDLVAVLGVHYFFKRGHFSKLSCDILSLYSLDLQSIVGFFYVFFCFGVLQETMDSHAQTIEKQKETIRDLQTKREAAASAALFAREQVNSQLRARYCLSSRNLSSGPNAGIFLSCPRNCFIFSSACYSANANNY